MSKYKNLTGLTFGRLVVIEKDKELSLSLKKDFWVCQCSCGNKGSFNKRGLLDNKRHSCGCLKIERCKTNTSLKKLDTTRFLKDNNPTPTYASWAAMKSRCTSKSGLSFKYYGSRNITFCAEWESFDNFLSDMGERPNNKTLDRINNELGYSKDNCRWATPLEQSRNSRNIHIVNINGELLCLKDAIEKYGNASSDRIHQRMYKQKWNVLKAILTPTKKGNYKHGKRN